MGSTAEGGLPTCVLIKRIVCLTTILSPESGSFWIDSTYLDSAKALLVIDRGFHMIQSQQPEENLLQIATFGWVRWNFGLCRVYCSRTNYRLSVSTSRWTLRNC
ncbi:hypothetical protein C8Q79DRAFT_932284 [Trametes meyenii]|nr:hypothetical protein C8Q79DRAFT_932284 [Trametes meyenii]